MKWFVSNEPLSDIANVRCIEDISSKVERGAIFEAILSMWYKLFVSQTSR